MGPPAQPNGSTRVSFDTAGIRFAAPGGWHVQPGTAPLVATVQSGTAPLVATVQSGSAMIAVWRYPRTEPLPASRDQLTQARDLLLQAAKARDATFRPLKSAITRLGSHPAIQVRGTETVSGQARSVRSTHVYAFGAEVVVDAYAPADVFGRIDRAAFVPLVRSLKLRAP